MARIEERLGHAIHRARAVCKNGEQATASNQPGSLRVGSRAKAPCAIRESGACDSASRNVCEASGKRCSSTRSLERADT
eukprot:4401448-Prymnesium_polylepis.2